MDAGRAGQTTPIVGAHICLDAVDAAIERRSTKVMLSIAVGRINPSAADY
jgi:hypothetical protein